MACKLCENAGLLPSPAVFELDYVCKGKRKDFTSTLDFDSSSLPPGCGFRCRDNITTSLCEVAAAEGACSQPAMAESMRFQCPRTCGVCKALGLGAGKYKRPACRDDEAHAASCPAWASSGECINNHGFMKEACPVSCGACRLKRKAGPGSGDDKQGRRPEAGIEELDMDKTDPKDKLDPNNVQGDMRKIDELASVAGLKGRLSSMQAEEEGAERVEEATVTAAEDMTAVRDEL